MDCEESLSRANEKLFIYVIHEFSERVYVARNLHEAESFAISLTEVLNKSKRSRFQIFM